MTVDEQQGDVRLLEHNAAPWIELCKEGASDAPFFRPEWIAAYLNAFEPGARLVLPTARAGTRLRAILPLVEKKTLFCGIPVRMLRGPANAHSCRYDAVRAPGEEGDRAMEALWNHLKKRRGWDVIELPLVAQGGSAERLVELARAEGYHTGLFESDRSPYFSLPSGKRADEIPHSGHFRQNLRRRIRKAKASWEVRLRRVEQPDPAELERFYKLESSGWKGQNNTAILNSPATRRFYDEIARAGSRFGYFHLYLLEFGDQQVAGHFGLAYNGQYSCPKVAYDESFSTYGPGHIIIEGIVQELLGQGYREFDFLGPWMDWKGEWTREGRTHYFWYIFRPGLFGNALHSAKMGVEPMLRRAVRRWRAMKEEREKAAAAKAKAVKDAATPQAAPGKEND